MHFFQKQHPVGYDVLGTYRIFDATISTGFFKCPKCQHVVMGYQRTPKFSEIETWHIDGLPKMFEKECICGSFHYCPQCGYTERYIRSPFFGDKIQEICIKEDQTMEDVAMLIANQYSSDNFQEYVIGTVLKYCTKVDSTPYFQRFVQKCVQDYAADIDYIGLDPYRLIVAVDAARMMGDIKTAKSLFRKIQKKKCTHPQLYELYDAEKEILKSGSREELYLEHS